MIKSIKLHMNIREGHYNDDNIFIILNNEMS